MKKNILYHLKKILRLDGDIHHTAKVFEDNCLTSCCQKVKLNKNWGYYVSVLLLLFTQTSFYGQNQSANLDQIRNGAATAPISPANWVNGNAGAQQAHYAEGWSIPYRMLLENLTIGSHTLVIEWDTRDNSKHAIDFITSYNNLDNPDGSHLGFGHTEEVIDPRIGISGLELTPKTFPIPNPANANTLNYFDNLDATLRLLSIYNGTITSVVYVNQDALTGASAKTRMAITFTADSPKVLIAWGGHIAAEYDWGLGEGATGISGSPYHTRLISLDGTGGNQDRSLAAAAVIIPPRCSVSGPTTACSTAASLNYTSSILNSNNDPVSYSWSLTPNLNSAGAVINGASNSSNVSVVPQGADFLPGTFELVLTVTRKNMSRTCSIVTTISAQPEAGNNGSTAICQESNVVINLFDLITGEQSGGSWSRTSGSGGTFDAAAGTYSLFPDGNASSFTYTITGIAPCTNDTSVATVNINPPPTAGATHTPILCLGGNSSLTISASGGTGPYEYSINGQDYFGGANGNVFTVVAGNYTVYVKDSKGCIDSDTEAITEPAADQPHISIGPGFSSYCGFTPAQAQAQLTIDFNNWLSTLQIINTGTLPYTITTDPENPQPPSYSGGDATVSWTITDACGKSETISEVYNVGGCSILCQLETQPTACNVAGYINVTASNGFPGYEFRLFLTSTDPPQTFTNPLQTLFSNANPGNVTFTGLAAGNYTVLILDQLQNTIETASACSVEVTRDVAPSVTEHCSNTQLAGCLQSQESIDQDYLAWFLSLAPTGGTNLQFTINVTDDQGNVVDNDGIFSPNKCGGSYTATVSYSDDCSQNGSCQGIYTIIGDTDAPVITTQNESGDLGCNPTEIVAPSFGYTDNCDSNLQVSVDDGDIKTDGCIRSQTWTASITDACGNAATPVSITYTWKVDTDAPVISCPDDYSLSSCDQQPILELPVAYDNCDGEVSVTAVRSDELALNDPFPVDEKITITYTAEDSCGNTASCSFTIYSAPCTGDTHCTYTQGFYGNSGGMGCSPVLGQVGSQAMMIKALQNNGGEVNFGLFPNNYFKLLLSDINGTSPISKNNIYKMLPGGGTPRALIGYNTYSDGSTWTDNDPLNKSGSQKGKINNVLLAQTMALFFNIENDPKLKGVILEHTIATGDVTYCGSNVIVPGSVTVFSIDADVINYLISQNGAATVNGLYELANKALGGGNISQLNHSKINSAVDAINRGFDECRIQVTVPSDIPILSEMVTEKDFTIYPVPFVSNFTILYNFDYESPVDIQIFDSKGNLILTQTDEKGYKGKEMKIEFPMTYQKGQMFFIRIQTNRGYILKNIVTSTN